MRRGSLDPLARFVDRGSILDAFRAALSESGPVRVLEIEGLRRSGKSLLLLRLAQEASAHGLRSVHVDLRDFDRDAPDDASGVLQSFANHLDLLSALAAAVGLDEYAGELQTAIDKRLSASPEPGRVVLERDADVRSRTFVRQWNGVASEGGLALLADEVLPALSRPFGRWFISGVLLKLENTTAVLTRTCGPERLRAIEPLATLRIGDLEERDVRTLLRRPNAADGARRILELTGGHVEAVECLRRLVDDREGVPDEDLPILLSALPPDAATCIAGVVDRILAAAHGDDEVQTALEYAGVARRLEPTLLGRLRYGTPSGDDLDSEEDRKEWGRRMLDRLDCYGFATPHPGERGRAGYYALHPVLHRELDRRLLAKDEQRYRRLHSEAEAFHRARMETSRVSFRVDRERGYREWERYERPKFQAAMTEWLYHVPRAVPDMGDLAILSFAGHYFEAFYWWGWYEPLIFCDELVAALTDVQEPWAPGLHRILAKFHRAYPPGPFKGEEPHDWAAVEDALKAVRTLVDANASTARDARRTLHAIVSVFLGDAYRYRDPRDERAEYAYRDALRRVQELSRENIEHRWHVAWVLFHLADLYNDRGATATALNLASQSLEIAREAETDPHRRDYEVIANCHRVRADAFFSRRQRDSAFANYAAAAFYAYVFQGWPQPADPYTATFYREMRTRLARAMDALGNEDSQAASRFGQYLREFWKPFWSDNVTDRRLPSNGLTVEELMSTLLPPEPQADDMRDETSPYVLQARDVADRMLPSVGAALARA